MSFSCSISSCSSRDQLWPGGLAWRAAGGPADFTNTVEQSAVYLSPPQSATAELKPVCWCISKTCTAKLSIKMHRLSRMNTMSVCFSPNLIYTHSYEHFPRLTFPLTEAPESDSALAGWLLAHHPFDFPKRENPNQSILPKLILDFVYSPYLQRVCGSSAVTTSPQPCWAFASWSGINVCFYRSGCFIRLSRDAAQALEKYPDIIFIQANYFVLSTLETGNEIVQLKWSKQMKDKLNVSLTNDRLLE